MSKTVPMDGLASLFQLGGALIQADVARSVGKANQALEAAQANSRNTIRAAANTRAASQASLSRALQGINNARFVRGREAAIARSRGAAAREQAAASAGRLEGRLRAAEDAGAAYAADAFSGVSGGLTETLLATRALQSQRQQQQARADADTRLSLDATFQGSLMGDMFSGQDQTVINTNLDLSQNITAPGPTGPSFVDTLLTQLTRREVLQPLVRWGASFFRPSQGTADSPLYADGSSVRRGYTDD